MEVISKVNAQSETEFKRTLQEYVRHNKRSMADILNAKAYFIAANALNQTHKTEKRNITGDLGTIVAIRYKTKTGRSLTKRKVAFTASSKSGNAPLAGLIINARRGKAGKPGLQGKKMEGAIKRMINARIRAINFARSSWIPAIRALATLVKKKNGVRPDTTAKVRGQDKGGCQPAIIRGDRIRASIWSHIKKKGGYLRQVLEMGLNKAFRQETASMKSYIEKKLAEDTAKFNKS